MAVSTLAAVAVIGTAHTISQSEKARSEARKQKAEVARNQQKREQELKDRKKAEKIQEAQRVSLLRRRSGEGSGFDSFGQGTALGVGATGSKTVLGA